MAGTEEWQGLAINPGKNQSPPKDRGLQRPNRLLAAVVVPWPYSLAILWLGSTIRNGLCLEWDAVRTKFFTSEN